MVIKVDFATHQGMKPVSAHGKLLAEQIDVAGLTGAANEDDLPVQRRMRIKFEMLGHRLPRWRCFGKRVCSGAVGSDISRGEGLQLGHTGHAVTLPDFGLPQGVEAFDGVLHAMFERRDEYAGHFELQAHAADAAYGVGMVMRALKHVVVVELRVRATAIALPAREQQRHRAFGAPAHCPSIGKRPMQTFGGEHIDQRPIGDLQIRDEVEAVEFGSTGEHRGQIPALGRRRASNTPYDVLQAKTRQRPIDRRLGRRAVHLSFQRRSDRLRAVFTQNTVTQLDAELGNALLYIGCDAVPGVTWLAIGKIQTIEPFAMGSLCPERNHALAKTKLVCGLTYTQYLLEQPLTSPADGAQPILFSHIHSNEKSFTLHELSYER